MALPLSTAALDIFVHANPEAWFSRLRGQAVCNDLNRAKASVRNREIFLIDLLQEQGGKPDGHYVISARTHHSFPRVLARAMFKDKSALWCLPSCSDIVLYKEEKEETALTKRFRAQVEAMSEYEMVRRIHEEGWIEEAGGAPVIVPGSEWQVSLRDEVDEALVSAIDVEMKFRQHFQEVLNKAKMNPGMLPLGEELEKIEEEIQAYLSANVYLFWATANLFQLASSSCLEMPEPSKEKMRSAGGRILRQYVAAVLCAEKGSHIVDAQEGGKRATKTIKAGPRSTDRGDWLW